MSTENAHDTLDDADLDQFLHSRDADPSALQNLHAAPGHTGSELMEDMRKRQSKTFRLVIVGAIVVALMVIGGIVMGIMMSGPKTVTP